ncbi:MAG: cytochrome d ubiquinol oxidase subunit II, partial [Muribaculaceae bacterium]|nr:cytochrome d ubiquinol oxidase subunit II [Muribaculaceae bacterium]
MTELEMLQAYWWLIIAVLGAALVFLLFVQGGQSMLYYNMGDESRQLMVNSLGRKWELTFTTLVVFGGAFFASFPLFYSTSFGGAYWLWMLILLSFVLQAVSYEFRRKKGNLYGTKTYDAFLMFNGLFGCVLLGVAVGMMFFGAEFTVTKTNILEPGAPVISQWAPSRGLEAIICWKNLLLGFAVFFLARTQAALYFINNIDASKDFGVTLRTKVLINGGLFAVLFVGFTIVLLLANGVKEVAPGKFEEVDYIYLKNLLAMWPAAILFVIGVAMVLYGIIRSAFSSYFNKGIWFTGIGTVLVVIVLFLLAGYNDTAYYRSLLDTGSSLTISNSSSSLFTLKTMSYVSILVPFVLAYIWYVWRKMNNKPLTAE